MPTADRIMMIGRIGILMSTSTGTLVTTKWIRDLNSEIVKTNSTTENSNLENDGELTVRKFKFPSPPKFTSKDKRPSKTKGVKIQENPSFFHLRQPRMTNWG